MFVQCKHRNGGYGVRACTKQTRKVLYKRLDSQTQLVVPHSTLLTFDPNSGL